jgi:hypothetical protein
MYRHLIHCDPTEASIGSVDDIGFTDIWWIPVDLTSISNGAASIHARVH